MSVDRELVRVRLVLAAMLVAFGFLAFVLWQVQVARGHHYESNQFKQSVRRIRVPGMRGRIYDRNGARLADNRPNYCIAIYLEELRQAGRWSKTIDKVEEVVDELSQILGLEPQITRSDIERHMRKRLPLPLLAWRGLDEPTLARWAERASGMPGVDVYVEGVRVYPEGASACHLLGYLGRAEPVQDEKQPFHYYIPEMAGKSGLERHYDELLRGEAGGRLVRVDVSGFRHNDLGIREPKAGHDLRLTLDLRIQKLCEEALAGESGAAVVLDPRTGEVLAMASSPGFDPNGFVPAMSSVTWNRLIEDERKPLLNRATAGSYTPGSIFKPIVAIAALEAGKAYAGTQFSCPGYFQLGRRRSNCWLKNGHGALNMRQGIQQSCNVYFWRLGLQCGYEYIYHMAQAVGLGQKTGIDLDYEVAGLVPGNAWKRRVFNDAWRDGDTCNVSIGQGALITTPIQMAVVAAAIANGGFIYRPRLVLGVREPEGEFNDTSPHLLNKLSWSPATLRVVRNGMKDVIMSKRGTGKLARIPDVTMAGKTGTAEYGKKGEGRKYGWMMVYAPFDGPRYAVVMVLDQAISGGVTVAPRVHDLMQGIFHGVTKEEGAG